MSKPHQQGMGDTGGHWFQDFPRVASIETLGFSVPLCPPSMIAQCVCAAGERDDDARNGGTGPYRVAAVCGAAEPRRVNISKILKSES